MLTREWKRERQMALIVVVALCALLPLLGIVLLPHMIAFARELAFYLADTLWGLIFLLGPILAILHFEETIKRARNYEEPEPSPVGYRTVLWSSYIGGLVLAGLYGNGVIG
jgi:hypothetical protein